MLLIIYYVVMILLDIRKANAMKAAELEKNSEEEIDISDEADTFKPVLITREDPNKIQPTDMEEQADTSADESQNNDKREESGDKEDKTYTETQKETSGGNSDVNPESNGNPLETTDKTPYFHPERPENKPADFSEKMDSENKTVEKPFRRDGYREALMTDGLEVERFLEEAEILASTGKGSLGDVVYEIYAS